MLLMKYQILKASLLILTDIDIDRYLLDSSQNCGESEEDSPTIQNV